VTAPRPAPPHPGEVSPLAFRQALGRFVSGVTVVTTARGLAEHPEVHGMTANAFTSVSLRPPLVLVSVSTRAHLDPRIAETGRYGVSVLGRDQEQLARHFAGGPRRPEPVEFVWRDGLPLVDGALVHLTCTVRASYPAGDHTLHVARVDSLWFQDGPPLVFYTGALRGLEAAAARSAP
jgi:flavin reductase (DIM6/NTAB) family NADH-FMN oxidoreductase RutF